MIDEADDDYTAYFRSSLALYNRGTFAGEEKVSLFKQLSLDCEAHCDWLDPVKQILRNLELADNPPVQLVTNAITNGVEQLDEMTTSIAKSSLLHKENTDLFTINPTFPGEARQEIQEQPEEIVEKVKSVPEEAIPELFETSLNPTAGIT